MPVKRALPLFPLLALLTLIAMPAAALQQASAAQDKESAAQDKEKENAPKAEDAKKELESRKELTGSEVAAPVDPKSYLIEPPDVIIVRVWREAELTGAHAVRPDGKITMPLVGDVQVGGLTPEQVKQNMIKALSEILVNPQVTVSMLQINSKKYTLTGAVAKTGTFPLMTPVTVFEALNEGGGFTDFANKKNIIIWRKGKQIKFNYEDVLKGKNLQQNILLEPGDHVIVPD